MINRERIINYLLRETRYTKEELEQLEDDTLLIWYKEEIEINRT